MVYNINDIENIYLSLTFLLGKLYIYTPRRNTLSSIYIFIRSINFLFFYPYPNNINLKNDGSHLRTMAGKYNLRKST